MLVIVDVGDAALHLGVVVADLFCEIVGDHDVVVLRAGMGRFEGIESAGAQGVNHVDELAGLELLFVSDRRLARRVVSETSTWHGGRLEAAGVGRNGIATTGRAVPTAGLLARSREHVTR